ncbi:MAG: hypothetical protein ABI878_14950 [Acidobacteriota bacterium]
MEATVTELPKTGNSGKPLIAQTESTPKPKVSPQNYADLKWELGLWFSGLESFLAVGNHSFVDKDRPKTVHDWSKEVRLTHSTLLLCSKLNFLLLKSAESGGGDKDPDDYVVRPEELREISLTLKDVILLNESLIAAEPLKFGVWKAWSNVLSEKLKALPAFERLIASAEKSGESFLPPKLKDMMAKNSIAFAERVDLNHILPRFAKILKWLNVVGKMLQKDEPLKPALLIFSRIYEQTREMIDHINNRLARYPDETTNMFGALDGAAYTASLELRKVYEQELTGIVAIRPSLSIYARVETAYSLLNDSFQQILTDFARLIEPKTEVSQLFPNFRTKLEQSLILREKLWFVLKGVRAAEKTAEDKQMRDLQNRLADFLNEAVHFLFYKDKESVERFVEEIFVTNDKQDLVGILHRFATYLETLFGQINIRAVLVDHPFEPEKIG